MSCVRVYVLRTNACFAQIAEMFTKAGIKVTEATLRERHKKVDKSLKEERAAKRKPAAEPSVAAAGAPLQTVLTID